jgi:hypothetical protein
MNSLRSCGSFALIVHRTSLEISCYQWLKREALNCDRRLRSEPSSRQQWARGNFTRVSNQLHCPALQWDLLLLRTRAQTFPVARVGIKHWVTFGYVHVSLSWPFGDWWLLTRRHHRHDCCFKCSSRFQYWWRYRERSNNILGDCLICSIMAKNFIFSSSSSFLFTQINFFFHKTKTKLRSLSPQTNYTDRETAACRRS